MLTMSVFALATGAPSDAAVLDPDAQAEYQLQIKRYIAQCTFGYKDCRFFDAIIIIEYKYRQ